MTEKEIKESIKLNLKRPKVYIASPYSVGDKEFNVKVQMDTFDKLLMGGFMPFAPLLFHFQHQAHPLSYDQWMHIDYMWLLQCDIVLRLPGKSEGADNEVKAANLHNIPVVYSIKELIDYYTKKTHPDNEN